MPSPKIPCGRACRVELCAQTGEFAQNTKERSAGLAYDVSLETVRLDVSYPLTLRALPETTFMNCRGCGVEIDPSQEQVNTETETRRREQAETERASAEQAKAEAERSKQEADVAAQTQVIGTKIGSSNSDLRSPCNRRHRIRTLHLLSRNRRLAEKVWSVIVWEYPGLRDESAKIPTSDQKSRTRCGPQASPRVLW